MRKACLSCAMRAILEFLILPEVLNMATTSEFWRIEARFNITTSQLAGLLQALEGRGHVERVVTCHTDDPADPLWKITNSGRLAVWLNKSLSISQIREVS